MATLEQASLSAAERRALERAIAALESELGEDLLAVWLYGSRARGEVVPPDSDIDLVAITREGVGWRERDRLGDLVRASAESVGADPWSLSLQVHGRDWVADGRRDETAFMQELDRDRLILRGLEGGEIPGVAPFTGYERTFEGIGGMNTQSAHLLEKAFERLGAAERLLVEGLDRSAVASDSYYAMVFAASAALTREGHHPRTHRGLWHSFHEVFVLTERFERALAVGPAQQKLREHADYGTFVPSEEEARAMTGSARGFVEGVSRMLGVEPF